MERAVATLAGTLRAEAPERFLPLVFVPPPERPARLALAGLEHELDRIPGQVSQPILGQMRVAWWREALDGLWGQGRVPAQPTLAALAEAGLPACLGRDELDPLLDAVERRLIDDPPDDLATLVTRTETAALPPLALALALGGVRDDAAMETARAGARAAGLVRLLRDLPANLATGRQSLPADLMTDAGAGAGDPPGRSSPLKVVRVLADQAREALAHARARRATIPKPARHALLPLALSGLYLGALAACGHDPWHPRLALPHPWRAPVLAWRAVVTGW